MAVFDASLVTERGAVDEVWTNKAALAKSVLHCWKALRAAGVHLRGVESLVLKNSFKDSEK